MSFSRGSVKRKEILGSSSWLKRWEETQKNYMNKKRLVSSGIVLLTSLLMACPVFAGTWQKNGNNWYYQNNGVNATGWVQDHGSWYYMNSSGAMMTGWQQINGVWYYMNPSGDMATGWINDHGTWYYMNPSGAMVTGWVQSNGKWYYMGSSGAMLTNRYTPDGCYVNSLGEYEAKNSTGVNNRSASQYDDEDDYDDYDNEDAYDAYDDEDDEGEDDHDYSAWTEKVIKLVNKERAKHGCSALNEDSTLMEAAQQRAGEIADNFSHDGYQDVVEGCGYDWKTVGENVAAGQTSPDAVMDSWMHSSGHKANILNKKFEDIGVGVYFDGSKYYWVQDFGALN